MDLKTEYEKNKDLVTLKESVKYPGLFVLKYKKKVFFDGLWNDFLEEARGLVVDKDFNVVSRPFTKVYNYGVEKQAPEFNPDEVVTAYRKINGFMLAATAHEGKLVVSTTGSLDSLFVDIGLKWIKHYEGLEEHIFRNSHYTFLFECVDESDPHIIEEAFGLYHLGSRVKKCGVYYPGSDSWMDSLGLNRVDEYNRINFSRIVEMSRGVKHEGFMVYKGDRVAKIKSPHYLTKKMLMRKNMDKLMSMDAKEFLDEEFYPLVDYIREVDSNDFFVLDELGKRKYIEHWFETQ